MTQKMKELTEREQRVIKWVSNLSDKELFGLECFLAGTRVAAKETQTEETPGEQDVSV